MLRQFIPIFDKKRVFALQLAMVGTDADDGNRVPFYMQPTLGGGQTLRTSSDYRFRDTHALWMNAEYRWEAFSALDMALFTDWGKVAPKFSDLDFSDLEHAYGIGFRFIAGQYRRLPTRSRHRAARACAPSSSTAGCSETMPQPTLSSPSPERVEIPVLLICLAGAWAAEPPGRAAAPRFYSDDPIWRDPETQDASTISRSKISDQYDLVENSFLGAGDKTERHAVNVNTVDEVPDSSWFTNRIGPLQNGAIDLSALTTDPTPAPGRRRARGRSSRGRAKASRPGSRFATPRARSTGSSSIPVEFPEMASGAEVISTKFFHAFGYHVAGELPRHAAIPTTWQIAPDATIKDEDGRRGRCTREDLDDDPRARRPPQPDGIVSRPRQPKPRRPAARAIPLLRHAAR